MGGVLSSRQDLGINDGCIVGCLTRSSYCSIALFRRCFRGAGLGDGLMPEPKRVKRTTFTLLVAWTGLWLACPLSGNFEVMD